MQKPQKKSADIETESIAIDIEVIVTEMNQGTGIEVSAQSTLMTKTTAETETEVMPEIAEDIALTITADEIRRIQDHPRDHDRHHDVEETQTIRAVVRGEDTQNLAQDLGHRIENHPSIGHEIGQDHLDKVLVLRDQKETSAGATLLRQESLR